MNGTLALFELHYERIWKKFWPTWSASLADFFLTSQYFIFSATGCKKLNTITRLQIILSISRSFVRSETRPDLTRKQSGRTKKIPSERTKSRIQQNNLFNCFTLLGALPWTPDKTFDIFLTSWDVWCLASGQSQRRKSCNKAPPNNKFIPALRKRENSVNSMAAYQVKVKYGEERFCTFLIKDITFAKLMPVSYTHLTLPTSDLV